MKLIRIARLIRRQAVVLHCEIDLCHLPEQAGNSSVGEGKEYAVNMRQGRTGEDWRESTRTPQLVTLAQATALFEQLLVTRSQQGFVDATVEPSYQATHGSPDLAGDAVLLARLQPAYWRTLSDEQRCRTVWRIGERRLSQAVPALVPLLESGSTLLDYCLAWTLGRGGDGGAVEALKVLRTRTKDEKVRRMALHAWLQLIDEPERAQHAEALIAEWPTALRTIWQSADVNAILLVLMQDETWANVSQSLAQSRKQDWLEQLDQVALSQTLARNLLLQQMKTLPLQAGYFRAIRHIYKMAEFREDAELFGILHHRFETTPATVSGRGGRMWLESKWVRYAKEVVRPDSRVAYNAVTRDYLRRRGWRTLRRLGEDRDPRFVGMAVGALQAMDDQNAGKNYSKSTQRWDRDTRQWQTTTRHYGRYSHWLLLNHLLHAHDTTWLANRTGRSWHRMTPLPDAQSRVQSDATRTEAFPALWEAQPDALLWLLMHAQCAAVHQFAARALEENVAYCAALHDQVLHALLTSAHPEVQTFAFRLCCRRYPAGEMPVQWLLLFLQSMLSEARQYALDMISHNPAHFSADSILVAAMLCSADDIVRKQGRIMCQLALAHSADPGQAALIVEQLLLWMEDTNELGASGNDVDGIAQNVMWAIQQSLKIAAAEVAYERLLVLLDASMLPLRVAAAQWLLIHRQPVSMVPNATLLRLLGDSDPETRSIGIMLFGALPDAVLLMQIDLFAVFCTHDNAGIRRAISPAVQRLALVSPEFCAALLPLLLDCLFRSEAAEGVHADIRQLLLGPLQHAVAGVDRDTVMRLLQARSKGAQSLGAVLLPRFAANDFTVREWAALGRSEDVSVRHWVRENFLAHIDLVRIQPEDGLSLLNSRWEDMRAFACAFFKEHFRQDDWNPSLLVNLCDHLDPAVQRFGREMLSTHFELDHVTDYMLKLSQHPSLNMQLFVSNWLESSAAGDLECLRKLEPYFLSVLSQVNRGRVVKNRVLAFLQQQVSHSEEIAALVAKLFARQVLTVAITDKAQYIDGLRAIGERYPNLKSPLAIVPPRPAMLVPSSAALNAGGQV